MFMTLPMRGKKSSLSSGSEVLQSLFEKDKSPLAEQYKRWKLWAKWADCVGQTVAENSEPVSYFRGTLYVWVKNSAWMQQFIFMRNDIKDTINRKLAQNYVRMIRFTLDRKEVPVLSEEDREKMVFFEKGSP